MVMKRKMKNGKMLAAGFSLAVALTAGSSFIVFAASSADTTDNGAAAAAYGYLTGQQKNSSRHAAFETAAGITNDKERELYLAQQGIGGGGKYSTAQQLDTEVLVTAGVIDQAAADSIAAFVSGRHDEIHSRYGNMADMTPNERHAQYESFGSNGLAGGPVDELLNAGAITQQQADAINAYLG